MCINVTAMENMPWFSDELTEWDLSREIVTPFIAMVFDQCNDPICTSGYLDFDIYSYQQPVNYGNPRNIH